MLEHAAREVAGDRLHDVIGFPSFERSCYDSVPQILEARAGQAGLTRPARGAM